MQWLICHRCGEGARGACVIKIVEGIKGLRDLGIKGDFDIRNSEFGIRKLEIGECEWGKVALLRPAVAGLRRVSGGRGDGGLVLA